MKSLISSKGSRFQAGNVYGRVLIALVCICLGFVIGRSIGSAKTSRWEPSQQEESQQAMQVMRSNRQWFGGDFRSRDGFEALARRFEERSPAELRSYIEGALGKANPDLATLEHAELAFGHLLSADPWGTLEWAKELELSRTGKNMLISAFIHCSQLDLERSLQQVGDHLPPKLRKRVFAEILSSPGEQKDYALIFSYTGRFNAAELLFHGSTAVDWAAQDSAGYLEFVRENVDHEQMREGLEIKAALVMAKNGDRAVLDLVRQHANGKRGGTSAFLKQMLDKGPPEILGDLQEIVMELPVGTERTARLYDLMIRYADADLDQAREFAQTLTGVESARALDAVMVELGKDQFEEALQLLELFPSGDAAVKGLKRTVRFRADKEPWETWDLAQNISDQYYRTSALQTTVAPMMRENPRRALDAIMDMGDGREGLVDEWMRGMRVYGYAHFGDDRQGLVKEVLDLPKENRTEMLESARRVFSEEELQELSGNPLMELILE